MHQSTQKSFGDALEMHWKSVEFDMQGHTLTPSYLYTCAGNQIRHLQRDPFHPVGSPFLILVHHNLSAHMYPYDVVGLASGPMWMCRVDESQVFSSYLPTTTMPHDY